MRKVFPFAASSATFLLSAVSAFAQSISISPPEGSLPIGSAGVKLENIPGFIINWLFIIGLIVAVAFLIYGGIKWILSGGDKTAVESARNHIIAAIIGLIIIVGAFFIVSIIFSVLGITDNPLTSGGAFTLPKLQ